jgi:hypothetical protein
MRRALEEASLAWILLDFQLDQTKSICTGIVVIAASMVDSDTGGHRLLNRRSQAVVLD